MSDDLRAAERMEPKWRQELPGGAPQWRAPAVSPVERFLGGSPLAVLVRLLVVSLLVGVLLMWLDLRPADVFRAVITFFDRLWALGFDSVREFAGYILAGAVIVVPVWFVLRLLNLRGAR